MTVRGSAYGLLLLAAACDGQQQIGSVATQDATVSGALEVSGGRAVLLAGSSSITAKDHAAEISLGRGGSIRVCQTSGIKLASGASATVGGRDPLLLALDRGAIEVKMQAAPGDAILTPDLRFAVRGTGAIDLRLRVTPNGDTCVEQRGLNAPTLVLTDTFGEAMYEIRGNQHVLFEHGSLREVVDHETSPCGCPEPARTMSLAEAALRPPGDAKGLEDSAASQHPFPAAESAGLAPTGDIPQAPAGVVHAQVAATLGYEGTGSSTDVTPAPPALASPAKTEPEEPHGFRHAVGRFFHKLFRSGS